jgi:hypothetical protein
MRWKHSYLPPHVDSYWECRPIGERSVFILLRWSVIDVRNMWEVPMESFYQTNYEPTARVIRLVKHMGRYVVFPVPTTKVI